MKHCRRCDQDLQDSLFLTDNAKWCRDCVLCSFLNSKGARTCNKCGRSAPLVKFSSNKGRCNLCQAAYVKNWRNKNRDKFHQKAAERNLAIIKEVLFHYSNGSPSCRCCGITNLEFLSIKHGGINFFKRLKDQGYPEGYEVQCFNCLNATASRGKCPHTPTCHNPRYLSK